MPCLRVGSHSMDRKRSTLHRKECGVEGDSKKQALAEESNPRFRGFGSWTATANRDENDRGNGLMPGPTSVTAAFGF